MDKLCYRFCLTDDLDLSIDNIVVTLGVNPLFMKYKALPNNRRFIDDLSLITK